MNRETAKEPRFDVVIYHYQTGIVEAVVGTNMLRDTGHYNAEKRMETAMMRCNENYGVKIVPAGKGIKGGKA